MKKPATEDGGRFPFLSRQRPTLPQGSPCSTMGPGGLNYRVRDGNGCDPSGMVAGKLKEAFSGQLSAISEKNLFAES